MPKSDTETVGPHKWVQITNADITTGGFQCVEGTVFLKATVGATEPTDTKGAWLLGKGEGVKGLLSENWPGISGANRVYAIAETSVSKVAVQHA